jgi:hypothetical protein
MSQLKDIQRLVFEEALLKRFSSVESVAAGGRRIGVPHVATDASAAGARLDLPPGEHVMRSPLPIWRRLVSGVSPRRPEPKGTAFCRTWDDVAFAVAALVDLRAQIETISDGLSQGAREAELDNLKKAVLETGRTGDGHVSVEGITNDSDLTIPGFQQFGDWLEGLGKPYRSDWDLDLAVTRGTSHGWPSFVPANDPASDVDLAFHAWAAGWLAHEGYSLADFSAAVREAAPALAVDVCAQMFFRTGPLSKPVPHYQLLPHAEGAVGALGTSTGYFCRERQVFAVPTCVNLLLRPAATRIKMLLRQSPSFKHGDASDLLRKLGAAPHLKFISEDISGFDRSVTRGMQRDLLKHVYSRFLTERESRLYDDLQSLPVLAPPLATDTAGYMYSRSGMTISGSIFTTNDGTIINAVSIAYSVSKALNIPLSDVWSHKGQRWDLFVLGDDCVVGLDDWSDDIRRAYIAARAESGFRTDLFLGAVFLMTSVSRSLTRDDNVAFGIISRAVSKTFFREDEARSDLVDLFGLYHRWARCAEHPLAPWAWARCIASAPGVHRLGVSIPTLAHLRAIVEHPSFVGLLLREARDAGVRASLRNLLTGIGHGDIIDGLRLAPGALAFLGGSLAAEFLATAPDLGTELVPDMLAAAYRSNRTLWLPYLNARQQDISATDAAVPLLPQLRLRNRRT